MMVPGSGELAAKDDGMTKEEWIKLSIAPIVVILAGIILNWSITGRIDDPARRLDAAVDKLDAVAVRLDARIDGIYEGLDRTRQEVTSARTDVSSRIDKLIDIQVDVAKRLADQGAQINALTVAIRERRDLGSLER